MRRNDYLYHVFRSVLMIILPNLGLGDEFAIVQPLEYATEESPGSSDGAHVWSNGYRMQLVIDADVFQDLGGYPADLIAKLSVRTGIGSTPQRGSFRIDT